jgi:aminopeptidase YwaD
MTMSTVKRTASVGLLLYFLVAATALPVAQPQPQLHPAVLDTPLAPETLILLANEVSGQMIFNNMVKLAGAPWVRDPAEFAGTFYEAQAIHDLVRSYGIKTTKLERYPGSRKIDYPFEGELWIVEPERRLVARLGADAALVAGGSSTADVSGELTYIPPMTADQLKQAVAAEPGRYRGKLALMWSHARDEMAQALDAAGVQAVISFSSRDRYLDPDQVVYSSGSYKHETLKAGFTVSWRQWSELFEDVQLGRKTVVRGKTRIETFDDKFETVFSWIPGTEPDERGVVFTAHLFEGYTKRGANDNMSGCVVQLEILRALHKLIDSGELPRPRRTIYFIWPNEISGTYEFIKRNPGFADKLSVNINMDMVGEALRKNNAVFTMSECPDHLPCYMDGLAKSVMNYVWRTNDIVYLPDSPRGRPGGQYFPRPMLEKNGTTDAFRFYIHRATGGSDHICFNNPSVAVPGIELFTWPDQWYHADTDLPDKGDPTQMKRVAFIGAATAWASAHCTDEVLPGLLDAVSDFGYARIAERDLPRALRYVESADAAALPAATRKALDLIGFSIDREIGALRSTEDIHTGSADAKRLLDQRVQQWELYRTGLESQVAGYSKVKGLASSRPAQAGALEKKYASAYPAIHPSVRGTMFSLAAHEAYTTHIKANPDALKELGLTPQSANTVLNYVNGKRSITTIRRYAAAETGLDLPLEAVAGYLELLRTVGWVAY